jgi:hypothetical protein
VTEYFFASSFRVLITLQGNRGPTVGTPQSWRSPQSVSSSDQLCLKGILRRDLMGNLSCNVEDPDLLSGEAIRL